MGKFSNIVSFIHCDLQLPRWVDESDGNDGQAEYQYNDGKEPKRSMASSEAAAIAIDVPAYSVQGRE